MKYKKLIFLILIVFFFYLKAEASSVLLLPSKNTLGTKEEFYVDLLLDTAGDNFNAISSKINFSEENLKFIRTEEGKSMVDLWVEHPSYSSGSIYFSGIMQNGFDGVIDPFDASKKMPGLIVRLVFETTKSGIIEIKNFGTSLNLNDGLGTEVAIPDTIVQIKIEDVINEVKYYPEESIPEINAYIQKDANLFNNKYVLIFEAKDSGSGIEKVLIKEGNRDWQEAENPYLLKDQLRHNPILVKAVNHSGKYSIFEIEPEPYKNYHLVILIILIILVFIFGIIRIKYGNKKNYSNQ